MFRSKQILIFAGVVSAVIACLVVALRPWPAFGAPDPAPVAAGERLAFAVRWLLVPGLALFAGVAAMANRRFFIAEAIDGERENLPSALEINLRYNQNTLEQLALAAIAWCGLALTLAPGQLAVIPRLAVLFGVGRALFWAGYLYAPWARAFGMGLTSYPTFAALGWLAWRSLTS